MNPILFSILAYVSPSNSKSIWCFIFFAKLLMSIRIQSRVWIIAFMKWPIMTKLCIEFVILPRSCFINSSHYILNYKSHLQMEPIRLLLIRIIDSDTADIFVPVELLQVRLINRKMDGCEVSKKIKTISFILT